MSTPRLSRVRHLHPQCALRPLRACGPHWNASWAHAQINRIDESERVEPPHGRIDPAVHGMYGESMEEGSQTGAGDWDRGLTGRLLRATRPHGQEWMAATKASADNTTAKWETGALAQRLLSLIPHPIIGFRFGVKRKTPVDGSMRPSLKVFAAVQSSTAKQETSMLAYFRTTA